MFVALSGVSGVNLSNITTRVGRGKCTRRSIRGCLRLFGRVAKSMRNIHTYGRGLRKFLPRSTTSSLRVVVADMRDTGRTSFHVLFSPALMHKVSCCAKAVFRVSVSRFNKSMNNNKHCSGVVNGFAKRSAPTIKFSVKFRHVIVLLVRHKCGIPADGRGGTFLVRGGVPGRNVLGILSLTGGRHTTNHRMVVVGVGGGGGFRGRRLTRRKCASVARYCESSISGL